MYFSQSTRCLVKALQLCTQTLTIVQTAVLKMQIPSERSLAPSASPTFEEQLPVKIQKRKRIERTICISRFYSSNAQNLLPSMNELSHMNQLFEFHIDHLKQQESSKQLHH